MRAIMKPCVQRKPYAESRERLTRDLQRRASGGHIKGENELRRIVERVLMAAGGFVAGFMILDVGLRVATAVVFSPAMQLRRASRTFPDARPAACQAKHNQPLGAFVQASPYQDIVYELKPNVDGCLVGGHVQTNHEGLRALDKYSHGHPKGVFRLLGLGDSLMFGLGVDTTDLYTLRVEQTLSTKLGRPVEFINMSVPGYNTAIEAAVLERRGLRYDPDVIVLHWCSNDFGVPFFLQYREAHDDGWELLRFVRERWSWPLPRRALTGELVRTAPELLDKPPVLDRIPSSYHGMVGWDGVKKALDRIQRVTTVPRKVPVVVITNQLSNFYEPPEVFKRLFTSHGFLVWVIECPREWRLSPINNHLNRQGHAGHAEQLIRALESLGLLPS